MDTETQRKHREEFYVMTEADQSDATINCQTPKIDNNQQKLGEKSGTDSPSEPPEGTNFANNMNSDYWSHELRGS